MIWRTILALCVTAILPSACSPRGIRSEQMDGGGRCALDGEPEVVARSETVLHLRWDVPDSETLWSRIPPESEPLRHFLAGVRARTDVDPRALLKRQMSVYLAGRSASTRREAENMRRVLEGHAGRIESARCLELALLAFQAARYPMFEQPTELGAFILRREGPAGARVRVYFSAGDKAAQKISSDVLERVGADVKDGWVVLAHLHNHPFLFDRKVGDRTWTTEENKDDIGGGISPSLTDVQFYRRNHEHSGLRGAWVTNGFDTLHLTAAEFEVLEAAE